MNKHENQKFVHEFWESAILPTLKEYICIPNKSPLFDAEWKKHGFMDQAVKLLADWARSHQLPNMQIEVVQLAERTPVILIEIPGQSADTLLLYGHLDKQPEMIGWREDLGPWKAVLEGDKLYGRGGADDGYAIFASLAAIKSLQAQNIPHARCVILIEASEESGSCDLPFYIDALETRIGKPNLVICLDSGCGNYEQLWITTSLRGMLSGILSIDVLTQGVHSGIASGVVPSCFMILRELLSRIENETNGKILLEELFVEIPPERLQQMEKTAAVLQDAIYTMYPFKKGVEPISHDLTELLINRTWHPSLSVTGAEGLPALEQAGNVTLPWLKIKVSVRLAPTQDAKKAVSIIKNVLESEPPFNADIRFEVKESASGWNAPKESAWLTQAAQTASSHYFGADAMYMGEGASIPFMGMLGKKFPQAQFLITGVLGPESNAHGPNEFLHIPTAKKLTCCVAEIIAQQYQNQKG